MAGSPVVFTGRRLVVNVSSEWEMRQRRKSINSDLIIFFFCVTTLLCHPRATGRRGWGSFPTGVLSLNSESKQFYHKTKGANKNKFSFNCALFSLFFFGSLNGDLEMDEKKLISFLQFKLTFMPNSMLTQCSISIVYFRLLGIPLSCDVAWLQTILFTAYVRERLLEFLQSLLNVAKTKTIN